MSDTRKSEGHRPRVLYPKEQTEKHVVTYTPHNVIFALRKLLDIESVLHVGGAQLLDAHVAITKHDKNKEQPFGGTRETWPFMQGRHAREPIDGKGRARQKEELMVMYIDLRDALQRASSDDRQLLLLYHVFATHTLDDLCVLYNVKSRGSMRQRIFRAVVRLTNDLEKT